MSRLNWEDLDEATAQHLKRLTAHAAPIKQSSYHVTKGNPDGLYDLVNAPRVGEVVYVHGSGHWRPGIVVKVNPKRYVVVHSTPSSGVLYTKTVRLSELRSAELRLA